MSSLVVGYLGIAVFLLLVFVVRMPMAFAFFLTGVFGVLYLVGPTPALSLLASLPFRWSTNFTLTAIPMFLLMGHFAAVSGISRDLYATAYKWIGHLPGGLALATIAACGAFAATSGSSIATAGAMGAVALPEMRRFNYSPTLAGGSVAAGGTLGILIPPSIILIIYGIMVEESIGKLFMAGIFPGLLLILLFCLAIAILVIRQPSLAPRAPSFSWRERFVSLTGILPMVAIFLLIIGGIYAGFFTPTEAGAVGAFGTFLFALGKGKLNRQVLYSSLIETVQTTCMVFLILIGAMLFGSFLGLSKVPIDIGARLVSLNIPPYATLLIILAIYLPLGCVMEALPMMLLTLPIVIVPIQSFGFDLIWFGILLTIMIECGLITPPMGINCFVIKGIAPDISWGALFTGILPFVIMDLVAVAIILVFPQIALFIPSLM